MGTGGMVLDGFAALTRARQTTVGLCRQKGKFPPLLEQGNMNWEN